MRILQIIETNELGGIELVACLIFRYLHRMGEESYLCVKAAARDRFIDHFQLSEEESERVLTFNTNPALKGLDSTLKLAPIIRKVKPDLIHTHKRRECMYVSLLQPQKQGAFHVRTMHYYVPNQKKIPFEARILRKHVDAWAATSQSLIDEHMKDTGYIDINMTRPIYNGIVDPAVKKDSAYEPQNKYCLVCRLSVQKGIDILLEQLRAMPQDLLDRLQIDIYGDGPEEDALIALRDKLCLNDVVHFMGVTKTPGEVMAGYDALLMPSRYEGLPMSWLEAMAVGTPVATHVVGCVREVIKHKENGWIIDESYTWEDFFKDNLVASPEYHAISKNARETYLEKYTDTHMCEEYYALYKSLMKNLQKTKK